MILSPLAITTNQQTYAAENNCTNWIGLHDNDCDGLSDSWTGPIKRNMLTGSATSLPFETNMWGINFV